MGTMKLLAYVPFLTPRIKYIFSFIFRDILRTEVDFSSNLQEFKASVLPKISYAQMPVADEVHFKNVDLLNGHTISKASFKTTAFGDTIVPFAVNGGTLPFDPFAAAFYFLSRYEEYIHFVPDKDGFYPAELSLQSRLKLLQIPVIDAWALIIKNILLKRYPQLYFGNKAFTFVPLTCLYPGNRSASGIIHSALNLLNTVKSMLKGTQIADRESEETRHFIQNALLKYEVEGRFFLPAEKEQDGEADGQANLPNSYLQLIKAGIPNDYRMGYKNTIGFRAGTCTPFLWYDLQLEKTTHLWVHPIAINDLSLTSDQLMHPETAMNNWRNLIDTVKLMNGHLYTIWHQDMLLHPRKGRHARKLYTEMLSNSLSLPYDLRPQ